MTTEQIKRLEKSNDNDVKSLLKEYKLIMESNNLSAYISMRDQLMDWDEQLKINENVKRDIKYNEGTDNETTVSISKGKIDLFADKETKEFDRASKYYDKILIYRKTLMELKLSLTEVESASLKESDTIKKNKEKNLMIAM